jgi:hypothetical protein
MYNNTHLSTCLHIIAKHSRRRSVVVKALGGLLLLVVVDVDDVKGVNVAGEVAEDGEGDVDEEVGVAACYDVDAYGGYCWVRHRLALGSLNAPEVGACEFVGLGTYGRW